MEVEGAYLHGQQGKTRRALLCSECALAIFFRLLGLPLVSRRGDADIDKPFRENTPTKYKVSDIFR